MAQKEVLSLEQFQALPDTQQIPMSQKEVLSLEEFNRLEGIESSIKSGDTTGFEVENNVHEILNGADRDTRENIKLSYERGDQYANQKQMSSGATFHGSEWYEKNVRPIRIEMERRSQEDPIDGNFIQDAIYSVAGLVPDIIQGGIKGGTYGAGLGLAVGVVPGGQALAPQAFAIGATYGSLDHWYRSGVGEIYDEMRDQDIDDSIAIPIAQIGGALYGAIELSQISRLLPGGNKQIKKMVFKSVKNTVGALIKRYGVNFVAAVSEEGLQEMIKSISADVATNIAGKD